MTETDGIEVDRVSVNILLISTYEMGRQPFGLASPAAWLRQAGFEVCCLDLSIDALDPEAVRTADLVAFYVPMHMGTRMAVPVVAQVRQINPQAHLCCYGLYAPVSADYLRRLGVDTILGGEFEAGLVALARRLSEKPRRQGTKAQRSRGAREQESRGNGNRHALRLISLDRQTFLPPDRTGLPNLSRYAHLVTDHEQHVTVGYTEASRGCKHLCRHCPIVPVYGGRFRIIQHEVVLADIRQQVAAGARHITFGDPDFFNGPGHAIPLVTALHQEFPHLTYDVTIKVEHLLKHAGHLPTLKQTGCLFITSAVESFDEHILTFFDKRHTWGDFVTALRLCRQADLLLVPTFVAFTPWTTLAGYRAFLAEIVRLGLVDQVSPIQCAIRLLIPPGSKLLELPEVQSLVEGLDQAKLSYLWRNPDPRVDALQRDLEYLVQSCAGQHIPRGEVFRRVWERAHRGVGDAEGVAPFPNLPLSSRFIPYLTEPWYC
ncbi:MAG: radical SAM protein [Chloroflexi bacterium]|nr:radical SAM protein [Chloroflexota bacterium]